MSTEAPPAPVETAPAESAPTSLLGGITNPPAPSAPDTPAIPPAEIPDDVPYIFKAINSNPELQAYAKQLTAKFDKADTPEKLIADLAKSYANLEKFKGKPGADADPAAVSQWRKLNGVPETPEGYGLLSNETLKSMGVDEAMASEYASDFHAANVSPEDAVKIIEGHKAKLDRAMEAQKTNQQNEWNGKVETLRKEHGQQFESVMRDATSVHKIAMATAGVSPEKAEQFANDPDYVRTMIALSKRMQSTPMVKGGVESIVAGDGARFEAMLRDPKSPLMDSNHLDHQRTIDEYSRHKQNFG